MLPSGADIEFVRKRGIQVGIGVHPKARMQHPDQWMDFHLALSTPGVVALGEIGLDFSGPSPSTQEARLENLLGYITGPLQVVIVHCRGRSNQAHLEVNRRYLTVFKRAKEQGKLMASQRVHLHCFNSTSGMVDRWRHDFWNSGSVQHQLF